MRLLSDLNCAKVAVISPTAILLICQSCSENIPVKQTTTVNKTRFE